MSHLQPFSAIYPPKHFFFFCLPAMASSSSTEQLPGWEWVFISDIANEAEMEEEVADPCSWTILDDKQPALSWEVYSFRIRFPKRWDDEPDLPGICADPRPFRNSSMWCFDVVLEEEWGWRWLDRAAVLLRQIPSPLVLTCCISETPVAFNMALITLAGNEVGQENYPKDDGDQDLSTQIIIFFADDVAHEQNLMSSENQKLCIVVEGLPRLVPDGTVL